MVTDGADGALVPPDDVRALAGALASVPLVAPAATAVALHGPDAVVAAHAAAYGAGA